MTSRVTSLPKALTQTRHSLPMLPVIQVPRDGERDILVAVDGLHAVDGFLMVSGQLRSSAYVAVDGLHAVDGFYSGRRLSSVARCCS